MLMTEEVSPDAAGSAGLDGLDMPRLAEELVESSGAPRTDYVT